MRMFVILMSSIDHMGLILLKTTTTEGKNQKFSRKVQGSEEAIQSINFSAKT